MRAKSTSITTAVNWVLNAAVGKFSPILLGDVLSISFALQTRYN